jgi:DNA-3-methyladenine glycosylase II
MSHGFVQMAPFGWDGEVLTRADRMAVGGRAHRVTIRQHGRELEIDVSGARSIPKTYEARIRRMLQLERDLTAFHRLARKEPHLRWIARGKFGRVLRSGDLFEDVTKAICGTNVQWPQAVKMANRIATLGPRAESAQRAKRAKAHGRSEAQASWQEASDGVHAFPSPEEVARAGAKWLRDHARTGYRSEYIVELARSVAGGALDVEAFERDAEAMSGDEVRRWLLGIKGIGPSTARYLAAFFGKHDAVSVDSAVIAYATRMHFGGKKPSAKAVERHFDRYGDHRGLVSWFEVWKDWRDRNE